LTVLDEYRVKRLHLSMVLRIERGTESRLRDPNCMVATIPKTQIKVKDKNKNKSIEESNSET